MKETLSDSFYNMEKLGCFNPKSVNHRVRGFIQRCENRLKERLHLYQDFIEMVFKEEAGEELANHSPLDDCRLPKEKSDEVSKAKEDTLKGCGKKLPIGNMYYKCGEDLDLGGIHLCPACSPRPTRSGDGE